METRVDDIVTNNLSYKFIEEKKTQKNHPYRKYFICNEIFTVNRHKNSNTHTHSFCMHLRPLTKSIGLNRFSFN